MWSLIFVYSLHAFIQVMVTIMVRLLEVTRGLISWNYDFRGYKIYKWVKDADAIAVYSRM